LAGRLNANAHHSYSDDLAALTICSAASDSKDPSAAAAAIAELRQSAREMHGLDRYAHDLLKPQPQSDPTCHCSGKRVEYSLLSIDRGPTLRYVVGAYSRGGTSLGCEKQGNWYVRIADWRTGLLASAFPGPLRCEWTSVADDVWLK